MDDRGLPSANGARRRSFVSWAIAAVVLTAVVAFGIGRTEPRDFILLVEGARPIWLVVALALQSLTYLAQAGVWQVVLRTTHERGSLWDLYKLSVAKLFVDQAVPSAGMSGTVLIARALARRGVRHGAIAACVVVETMTNFSAFVLALVIALSVVAAVARVSEAMWLAAFAFIAAAVVVLITLWRLSSGQPNAMARILRRLPGGKTLLSAIAQDQARAAHDAGTLARATALNFAIHLLDAATLWALLAALGVDATLPAVFASFMLSTLVRTIGVLPGGFGTFEAASVGALNLLGVPLAAALSATLLFRGISFFLPLLPGLLLSRSTLATRG